jgi:hypothetical protein
MTPADRPAPPPLAVDCPTLVDSAECSGHGTCMSLEQIGLFYGHDLENMPDGTQGWGPRYRNWDANITSACYCDIGERHVT